MSIHKNHLKDLAQLAKVKVSIPVAFSALTGYIAQDGTLGLHLLLTFVGVFFFSASSSALNQIQEHKFDPLMERTHNRPLATQTLNKFQGLAFSLICFSIATISLFIAGGWIPVFIGIITMVWYNLVYTPLKRKTAFAVVPGALVGAFPPVIGWVAAGGGPFNYQIVFIAFFFFMGQIPHFWLILLKYGEQYRAAGFAVLNDIFDQTQILRLSYIWVVAASFSAVMIPFFNIITHTAGSFLILIFSFSMALIYFPWLKGIKKPKVRTGFMLINIYYLLIMLIIIWDALSK